jgi:hypothetical protein
VTPEVPASELSKIVPTMTNNNIPWIDSTVAVFAPHSDNIREHDSVIQEYEQSIMDHGIVQDCRGRLFAVLSLVPVTGHPGQFTEGLPLRLLTWGSLGRALYSLLAKAPENENVKASLAAGLANVCVMRARLPADCIAFVRDYHNLWHHGASDSFIKVLRDTREVEANWEAFCNLKNPSRVGLGTWLADKYPGKYSSANEYESAKIALHKLDKLEVFESFCEFCSAMVSFRDRAMNTHDAIVNLHTLLLVIEKVEHTVDDIDTRKAFLMEGFKLMVPLNKANRDKLLGKRLPPLLLEKAAPAKIRWLLTDMTIAKVFSQKPQVWRPPVDPHPHFPFP